MALSKEEQDQLDALNAKATQAEDDDDYEIEIWDSEGAGARVPYHKGKSWLNRFGIDLPEPPADDNGGDDNSSNAGNRNARRGPTNQPRVSTTQKYFGKRNAPK